MKSVPQRSPSINKITGRCRQKRQHRAARNLRVLIEADLANGAGRYAAVIINWNDIHLLQGSVDSTSEERVWLHALSLCYEWRDTHAPTARLLIDSVFSWQES